MGNEDLLARMVRTKAGWGWDDLDQLYTSFGFDKREGGKHTVYTHRASPFELRATVTRQRSVAVGYIQTAIKLVRRLKELQQGDTDE